LTARSRSVACLDHNGASSYTLTEIATLGWSGWHRGN
jgi:hypothetical protein